MDIQLVLDFLEGVLNLIFQTDLKFFFGLFLVFGIISIVMCLIPSGSHKK